MAKPKREGPPALSEAQFEIMQVVWEGDEVTVTDVWNVLAQRRQVARNTVLTLMERLEKKGWLTRRADGRCSRPTSGPLPRRVDTSISTVSTPCSTPPWRHSRT